MACGGSVSTGHRFIPFQVSRALQDMSFMVNCKYTFTISVPSTTLSNDDVLKSHLHGCRRGCEENLEGRLPEVQVLGNTRCAPKSCSSNNDSRRSRSKHLVVGIDGQHLPRSMILSTTKVLHISRSSHQRVMYGHRKHLCTNTRESADFMSNATRFARGKHVYRRSDKISPRTLRAGANTCGCTRGAHTYLYRHERLSHTRAHARAHTHTQYR